jgi:hypothetical protein
MFANVKAVRAVFAPALLACAAVSLIALTGCSSAGSTSSSASAPGTSAPASTSASAAPSWAAALGSGATVVPPGSAAAGHGSPASALVGLLQAVKDKSRSAFCGYSEPSTQAQCTAALAKVPDSYLPAAKNAVPGYFIIEGSKAVGGMTGTLCALGTSECTTNTDPAALFTTLHTFAALWKNAITSTNTKYSLTPFIKVNGNWYVDSTS